MSLNCARTLTAAAGLLLVAASPAGARLMTGNELLEACTSRGSDFGLCMGYINGAADLAQILTLREPLVLVTWCRPTGVTNSQLVDVVVRDLRKRPETRHHPALGLILAALGTAFPCN